MNKVISALNSFRFFITEPILLKFARLLYSHLYKNKNQNPLISICVPTYNRADLLMERAIPSVLNQTYQNFELIIVGDHCTDDTEKRVSEIKDKRIRFYNIPKRGYRYPPTAENHWLAGPVVAINQALKMVKGDWIARIDDDDFWTTDHLQVLLDFAESGNYEFVSSKYERETFGKIEVVDGENADGKYFNPKASPGSGPKLGGVQTWLYRSYLKFMKPNINCWRKNWNRVNDVDLQHRIYKAGARIGFLDQITASITPRPGEQTIGLQAYKASAETKIEHFKFLD